MKIKSIEIILTTKYNNKFRKANETKQEKKKINNNNKKKVRIYEF